MILQSFVRLKESVKVDGIGQAIVELEPAKFGSHTILRACIAKLDSCTAFSPLPYCVLIVPHCGP